MKKRKQYPKKMTKKEARRDSAFLFLIGLGGIIWFTSDGNLWILFFSVVLLITSGFKFWMAKK